MKREEKKSHFPISFFPPPPIPHGPSRHPSPPHSPGEDGGDSFSLLFPSFLPLWQKRSLSGGGGGIQGQTTVTRKKEREKGKGILLLLFSFSVQSHGTASGEVHLHLHLLLCPRPNSKKGSSWAVVVSGSAVPVLFLPSSLRGKKEEEKPTEKGRSEWRRRCLSFPPLFLCPGPSLSLPSFPLPFLLLMRNKLGTLVSSSSSSAFFWAPSLFSCLPSLLPEAPLCCLFGGCSSTVVVVVVV